MKASKLALNFDISRVDKESRIIEGYCYVNEVVPGEGGVRLKRSAMEAATEDYMRWGAVREMHRPSAVGTATAEGCGITWDEKGALFRAKIVDDAAWEKVQEGVYKALSVYVAPRIMRGKDVESCSWTETSLVDRPKDKDSTFSIVRVEGDEVEVLELPDEDATKDLVRRMLEEEKAKDAETHKPLLRAEVKTEKDQFARLEVPEGEGELLAISRADIKLVVSRLDAQKAEITRLENTPRAKPPVRFTDALDKTPLKRFSETNDETVATLTKELATISAQNPRSMSQDARIAASNRISEIKSELNELGA